MLVAVQFACLIALLLVPGTGMPSPIRVLLARLLALAAALVLAVAFINLRAAVTVFPEPREGAPFVTHGIYAWVRHPMYLGVLLFAGSLVVTKWTVPSLIIWLVLLADLRIKHRYEDRLLAARWPEAVLYQATVGALLPRPQPRP